MKLINQKLAAFKYVYYIIQDQFYHILYKGLYFTIKPNQNNIKMLKRKESEFFIFLYHCIIMKI